MKININVENKSINEEYVVNLLKKFGIKSDIKINYCEEKCFLDEKKEKNVLNICLRGKSPRKNINLIIGKFIPYAGLSVANINVNTNVISINFEYLFSSNSDLESVIKHEILHLIQQVHCTNKECLHYKIPTKSFFCESCKEKFKEAIKLINGDK